MGFSNPGLWLLAASVAVPVVLHLIMRQNPKKVLFPALRFIQQRRESNRRRLRLRHLILLALRMLVLLWLAAALARPSVNATGLRQSRQAPVSAALVFDTSPSMEYQFKNQTRLDSAREMGRWLLTQLPEESQVAVLDSTSRSGAFEVDLAQADDRARRLETTVSPHDYLNVVAEALRLLEKGEHEARELYLFTDLSQGEWSRQGGASLASLLEKLDGLGVYIIDVGAANPRNTALGELRLSGEVLARNSPVFLEQQISRTGGKFSSEVVLTLEGTDINRKAKAHLETNDSQTLSFRLPGLDPGTYQGEIRIVEQGGNLLKADDKRFFTLEVKPAWSVLLVAPHVNPEAYAFDVHRFLAPQQHRDENRARFDCAVLPQQKLADTDLADFDAVWLLDPVAMPAAVWEKLATYARTGGGVAILLGRNALSDRASFNAPAAQQLLAGELLQKANWPRLDVHLDPPHGSHPVLAKFAKLKKDHAPHWNAFWIEHAWQLVPPEEGVTTLIPFTNGQPALLERKLEQGTVLTLTTPLSDRLDDEAWNNLPTGLEPWPTAMLVNEMMLYLAGTSAQQLNYRAGQGVTLKLERGQAIDKYKLIPPSGRQDERWRDSDPNRPSIAITSLSQVGNYRVERRDPKRDLNLDRGFSVNLSPDESVLTRATEEDVKSIFGETPFKIARNQHEVERDIVEVRVGHELFPWLIVLVALLLGAEYVMANRFYGKDSFTGGEEAAAVRSTEYRVESTK